MRNALDIGACLKRGWEGFVNNAAALIVDFLIVGVVSGVTLGICVGPMMVGYSEQLLKAARGESLEIGGVFGGFRKFGPSFVLFLLMAIAMAIGFVLLFVPGLILAWLFYWAPYLMAEGDTDPISCLRRSAQISMNDIGGSIAFVLVNMIISSIGSLVAFGSLVTGPIAGVMAAEGIRRAQGPAVESPISDREWVEEDRSVETGGTYER